jgi:hypothetical protein
MLAKLKAFWDVLQKGKSLADKEVWADRATRTGTIAALLSALAALVASFGYDINISATDANEIAAGISAVVAVITAVANLLHVASNDAAGRVQNDAGSTVSDKPSHGSAHKRPGKAGVHRKPDVPDVEDFGLSDVELLARTVWGMYADHAGKMEMMAQCLAQYDDTRRACLSMECWQPGDDRRIKVLLIEPGRDAAYDQALVLAEKALGK